ncbi:hypothetical protein [Thioclava kandeliae]|uniref:DNA-binding protein n=1 Tax=Thioclava kandeliae TaxID=3070818 RepID=A0ABV1SFF0_9RHOB
MGKFELITLKDAAEELGVPVRSLTTAAEEHGFIVYMGRAKRLEKDSLGELIKKCRAQPKAPASTNSPTGHSGISETQANPIGQRAAQAAKMLRKRSQPTSPQKGAQVTPLSRRT